MMDTHSPVLSLAGYACSSQSVHVVLKSTRSDFALRALKACVLIVKCVKQSGDARATFYGTGD